jgi:hypothetical protein
MYFDEKFIVVHHSPLREGHIMGKIKRKKVRLSIVIEKESLEIIDFYTEKLQRSRAEVVRALINLGLDEPRVMNGMGVFKIRSLKEMGVNQLPIGRYE